MLHQVLVADTLSMFYVLLYAMLRNMRRSLLVRNSSAAVYEFVDPSFLNNKRPVVPGGAWPVDLLATKSVADLQQIWFQLVKERNMLVSTKEHYLKHQEELGAMPAPTRIKLCKESMANIKQVMRDRDNLATDRAVAVFRERLAKGIYRYPPGPAPPPGSSDPTSVVKITLSKKVSKDRLQELFGKYDVYEAHKGIARIDMELAPEALEAKQRAEVAWEHYMKATSDYAEYNKWVGQSSRYDYAEVEVAPGVFEPVSTEDEGTAVEAAKIAVPEPLGPRRPPQGTVSRLKFDAQPSYERQTIQLGYYPNITRVAPEAPPTRPVHPDEIEGPWIVHITYDARDGLEYATSLQPSKIDGADVLSVCEGREEGPAPYAATCPIYQEALRAEGAAEATLMQWPNVPQWRTDYYTWTHKNIADIVAYNYTNVVDYVDREVLLTGKSVWETPIEIDYTCGQARSVPVHAQPPTFEFPTARNVVDVSKL